MALCLQAPLDAHPPRCLGHCADPPVPTTTSYALVPYPIFGSARSFRYACFLRVRLILSDPPAFFGHVRSPRSVLRFPCGSGPACAVDSSLRNLFCRERLFAVSPPPVDLLSENPVRKRPTDIELTSRRESLTDLYGPWLRCRQNLPHRGGASPFGAPLVAYHFVELFRVTFLGWSFGTKKKPPFGALVLRGFCGSFFE